MGPMGRTYRKARSVKNGNTVDKPYSVSHRVTWPLWEILCQGGNSLKDSLLPGKMAHSLTSCFTVKSMHTPMLVSQLVLSFV